MKKVLFALLLVLPFVFNSCSSDDDDDVKVDSLNGTTWVFSEVYEKNWEWVETVTFSKSTCQMVLEDYAIKTVDGKEVKVLDSKETISGTYEYKNSKGTMILIDEDNNKHEATFTVNGKTLTIKGQEETKTYTKK